MFYQSLYAEVILKLNLITFCRITQKEKKRKERDLIGIWQYV